MCGWRHVLCVISGRINESVVGSAVTVLNGSSDGYWPWSVLPVAATISTIIKNTEQLKGAFLLDQKSTSHDSNTLHLTTCAGHWLFFSHESLHESLFTSNKNKQRAWGRARVNNLQRKRGKEKKERKNKNKTWDSERQRNMK